MFTVLFIGAIIFGLIAYLMWNSEGSNDDNDTWFLLYLLYWMDDDNKNNDD